MKKKKKRLACWKCGHPYEFDVLDALGPETLRAMARGVRRQRYLQYCNICKNESTPVKEPPPPPERTVVPTFGSQWNYLKFRHLEFMGHRCQICAITDRKDVTISLCRKKEQGRYMQRDVLALCELCHDLVSPRLALNEGKVVRT